MSIAEAMASTPASSVDLTRFVSAAPDASVADTVALMSSAGRSCAIVVENGAVAGIFTQRDFLQRVIGRPTSWQRPIAEEMTTPVHTMRDTDSVADGLALMNHWWVRSVPVVDESGQLAGNLSFYTVISTIAGLLASRISDSIGEPTVHHGLTLIDFTGIHMAAPVVVHADDSVDVAVHHMRARGIGSVVVVNDRDQLVGELTEFDLQTKIGCREADLSSVAIKDVMEPDPVSIRARSSIAAGIQELLDNEVSHVPLIGESHRPVGVASFRDIAMYVESSLETLR